MSKTKVIAFANNKGGSGKTTSCSNIGCALAKMGKRVLMIDGDMQLNLTLSFFDEEKSLDYASNGKNIYTAIKEEKDLSDFVVSTEYEGLDIIPSTSLMSSVEFDLFSKWQREFILRKCLAPIYARGYYDYILIDCPPSLNLITINALVSSNSVIVPLQSEFLALEGLTDLVKNINLIKKNFNPVLDLQGIVLTMYDKRNNLSQMVETDVRKYFGAKVYNTVIPRSVRISEAPSHGMPVLIYDFKISQRSS